MLSFRGSDSVQCAFDVMKFEEEKDKKGNVIRAINPYVAEYNRLKVAGKIKTASDSHYKCSKCHDTGWMSIKKDGQEYMAPCKCRAQMLVQSRLKKSGINPDDYERFSLTTFCTDTVEHRKMKELAIRYLRTRKPNQGIAYTGESGTGKTHICVAICQELTRNYGEEHFYFSYRTQIQRIKASMYDQSGRYMQLMNYWSNVNNLYIDDMFKFADDGKGRLQMQDKQIMFDLINNRYINRKATIFSSEKKIDEILKIDEALGSRIRAITGNFGMYCKGENMRLKGAV